MQRKIQKKIRERLFRNRSNQKLRMVSAVLSVLVVTGTVTGLILPAQAPNTGSAAKELKYG